MKFLLNCSSYADIQATATVKRLSAVVAALILFCVGISFPLHIEAGWSFKEGYPMTMLSVFFLFIIGHFCLKAREILGAQATSAAVWKLLGISFIFLGFDDWLRIHETIDHTVHKVFRIHETELTDHLDDAIVGAYALMVGFFILRAHRQLWEFLPAIRYLIPAVFFSAAHVALDVLVASRSLIKNFTMSPESLENVIVWGEVIEETCKLSAEVFLIATIVHCYTMVRDRRAQSFARPI